MNCNVINTAYKLTFTTDFNDEVEAKYGGKFVSDYQHENLTDDVYDRIYDEWEEHLCKTV